MKHLPSTIEALDTMPQYSIELDLSSYDCNESGPYGQWRGYDTLVTEGSTIDELLDNATVWLQDQDGGSREGDVANWMYDLIQQEYLKLINVSKGDK